MTEKNTSLNFIGLEVLLRGLNDQKTICDDKYVAFYDENEKLKSAMFKDVLTNYLTGKVDNPLLAKVKSNEILSLCETAVGVAYAMTAEEETKNLLTNKEYSKLFNDIYCACTDEQRQHCKELVAGLNNAGVKNNLAGSVVVAEEYARREALDRMQAHEEARTLTRK